MPLCINVGLSRKASRDYQSTGVSINVTAELDQSLLARPAELQREIDNLYSQAEQALEHQAGAAEPEQAATPVPARNPVTRYNRPVNGNGGGNGNANGHSRNGGSATDSQRRAISAIARRLGVDPALEARDVIGAELDALTISQASELIDHLKALQPVNGRSTR